MSEVNFNRFLNEEPPPPPPLPPVIPKVAKDILDEAEQVLESIEYIEWAEENPGKMDEKKWDHCFEVCNSFLPKIIEQLPGLSSIWPKFSAKWEAGFKTIESQWNQWYKQGELGKMIDSLKTFVTDLKKKLGY